MKRWIDLDELRRDIAAEAKAHALAAGLEQVIVQVIVRVTITVDVAGRPAEHKPGPAALALARRR